MNHPQGLEFMSALCEILICCRLCKLCCVIGWSATPPCWSPQTQKLPCGMKLTWSWLLLWMLT